MAIASSVREALPAERAYVRRVAAIVDRLDALTNEQVRVMRGILADVRRRAAADLALVPQDAGTWPAHRLRSLMVELDRLAAEINTRYGAQLADASASAWDLGAGAAPDALQLGGELPALSRAQFEVASQLQADLVRRVTQEFRTRAAAEVTRAVLGGQSPYAATQAIAAQLTTQPGRAGMGTVAAQAERIVRTETMTVFNLANTARQAQVAKEAPKMRKTWIATNDDRTREDHADAGDRYAPGGTPGPIPVDAMFVVGGYRCSGPHSPMLPADQRVNCRCTSSLWSPDWKT